MSGGASGLTYDAIRNAKGLLVRLEGLPLSSPVLPGASSGGEALGVAEAKMLRQALFDFIQSADVTRLELERLQKVVRGAARDLLDEVL